MVYMNQRNLLTQVLSIVKSKIFDANVISIMDNLKHDGLPDIYSSTLIMCIFHDNEKLGKQLLYHIDFTNVDSTIDNIVICVAILFKQWYIVEHVCKLGIELTNSQIYKIYTNNNIELIKFAMSNIIEINSKSIYYYMANLCLLDKKEMDDIVLWMLSTMTTSYDIIIDTLHDVIMEDISTYYSLIKYLVNDVNNIDIALYAFICDDAETVYKNLNCSNDIVQFMDKLERDWYVHNVSDIQYTILNNIVSDGYALPKYFIDSIFIQPKQIHIIDLIKLVQKSFDIKKYSINLCDIYNVLFHPNITYNIMNILADIFIYTPDKTLNLPNNVQVLQWLLDNEYDFSKNTIGLYGTTNINDAFVDFAIANNISINLDDLGIVEISIVYFEKLHKWIVADKLNYTLDSKTSVFMFKNYMGLLRHALVNISETDPCYTQYINLLNDKLSMLLKLTFVPADSQLYIMNILYKTNISENRPVISLMNRIISIVYPKNELVKFCKDIYTHTPITDITIAKDYVDKCNLLYVALVNKNVAAAILLSKYYKGLVHNAAYPHYELSSTHLKYITVTKQIQLFDQNSPYDIIEDCFNDLISTIINHNLWINDINDTDNKYTWLKCINCYYTHKNRELTKLVCSDNWYYE